MQKYFSPNLPYGLVSKKNKTPILRDKICIIPKVKIPSKRNINIAIKSQGNKINCESMNT